MSTTDAMPLREMIARILCDTGGSWDTDFMFSHDDENSLERRKWYLDRADAFLRKYATNAPASVDEG